MSFVLKRQDVVVILKLLSYQGLRPPYTHVSVDLGMSPSEVHGAVKRAQHARLLHSRDLGEAPNIAALEEFLLHGIKYVFPAERGGPTRGMLTSYAAEPLRSLVVQTSEPPPVWPYADGGTRGIALMPLHRAVPFACSRDMGLYEMLALVDAIRDGRTRERRIAESEIVKRLQRNSVSIQP